MSNPNQSTSAENQSPWRWVPTLYFTQGIPYVFVATTTTVLYKDFGLSNSELAFWTSWLTLPWVIKGIWSPIVDLLGNKRQWICLTQFLMGIFFGIFGLLLPLPFWWETTFILFWLIAFSSATHDIAADGFYLDALTQHQQVWFSGIRNTAWRIALIVAQGVFIMLVGFIDESSGLSPLHFSIETSTQQTEYNIPIKKTFDSPSLIIPNTKIFIQEGIAKDSQYQQEMERINNFKQIYTLPSPLKNKSSSYLNIKEKQNDTVFSQIQKIIQQKLGIKKDQKIDNPGHLQFVPIYLTHPPQDEKTVITISLKSGDSSFKILSGSRHEFTKENWKIPAITIIQADARSKIGTQAIFTVRSGNKVLAWAFGGFTLAAVYLLFAIYHFLKLPQRTISQVSEKGTNKNSFFHVFYSFFTLPGTISAILFILLYRLGENQLTKIAVPFLMDPKESGGMGLTTSQVGFVYGTIGVFCLLGGGILGAWVAAMHGLKKWIWLMAIAMNLPNIVYVYLAYIQPDSFYIVASAVAIEQLGYGFGFSAFMLFMLCHVENSPYKAAHYAILTGFMALGALLTGQISGWIQETLGYQYFFIWILLATIPGFIMILFIRIPEQFGKKIQSQK